MAENTDGVLGPLIRISREKFGLSPNQISAIGLIVGLLAAGAVAAGWLLPGLLAMAVAQVIDGIDGGVARRYGLLSKAGMRTEIVVDRLSELAMFLALAAAGLTTLRIAALAFAAILLVTAVEPYSKFDPGFKRFMIYFGYAATVLFRVDGFQIALTVIFFANLAAFAVGTIIADYRLQREIDAQAILRRAQEKAGGIPGPPDDPPSFLSKIFS